VQFGQRVALIGMVVKQCGHSFVVGSAGAGCGFIRFIVRTIRKMTKATMMKSMMVVRKMP